MIKYQNTSHSCVSCSVKCGAPTMGNGFFKSPFWIQKLWKADIWTWYSYDLVFYDVNFSVAYDRSRTLGDTSFVSVFWQEEGYMMKYSLSSREIPRAKPKGFPEGSGYISLYILTWVTIQTFSITTLALTVLGDQYWKSWFSVLLCLLGNTRKYCPVDWAILESWIWILHCLVIENFQYTLY